RVAISNHRIVDIEDGQVKFKWRDYRDNNQQKTMPLTADEFIRRFLLHVLPSGFHRIRYYGFLGNRHRKEKLEQCRQLLGSASPKGGSAEPTIQEDCRDGRVCLRLSVGDDGRDQASYYGRAKGRRILCSHQPAPENEVLREPRLQGCGAYQPKQLV